MPGLDAVRGLAILSVVSYHELSWQIPLPLAPGSFGERVVSACNAGFLGVQLFFVLSGFLITGILLDARRQQGFWSRFYVNRLLRLMPALVLALTFVRWRYQASWIGIALSVFYLGNLVSQFGITSFHYNIVWSLAVEEQFYLVWPVLVRLSSRRALTLVATTIMLVAPWLRYISAAAWLPLGNPQSMTWLLADKLAAGGLLALFLRSAAGAQRKSAKRLCIVLFAASTLLLVWFKSSGFLSRASNAGLALQPIPFNLLFCAFVLLMLLIGDRPWVLRSTSPLRFLGHISYGLYLYHELIFSEFDRLSLHKGLFKDYLSTEQWLLRFVVVGGFAVVISYLSRRYIEEFFLGFKFGTATPVRSNHFGQGAASEQLVTVPARVID